MIAIRVRVHDIDGGQMVPEYVGGSIPALKCRRCNRFVGKEWTRTVERYMTDNPVRDVSRGDAYELADPVHDVSAKVQIVALTFKEHSYIRKER